MTFKEILQKISGRGEDKEDLKEYIKELDKRTRAEEIVADRKKSANQRELERYYKEQMEQKIKEQLEDIRRKRQDDINFGHNPLNTKNVVSHTDWEVLKERSLFKNNGNMFMNQKNIFAPKRRR